MLQNSYFSFLLEAMLAMCVYLALSYPTSTFLDIVKAMNPVAMWVTCGAWFMENDLSLSFAGNEFWSVGVSAVMSVVFVWIGHKRYRKMEFKP